MEPLVAVFRVRNPKTGQAKFGECWIKPSDDPLEKIHSKKLLLPGETIDGLWTIAWRNEHAAYNLVVGTDPKPDMDVAANMRARLLKQKGKKPRAALVRSAADPVGWKTPWRPILQPSNTVPYFSGYVDKGIEDMSAADALYSIIYPEHAEEKHEEKVD